MKRFLLTLRPLLILLLTVITTVSVQTLRVSTVTSRAQAEEENTYLDYADDYKKVIEAYHEKTNELFNKRIARLVKMANEGSEEDLKKLVLFVTPPALEKNSTGDQVRRTPCPEENISTYCVAQEAVDNYVKFRAGIQLARDRKKQNISSDIFENIEVNQVADIDDVREGTREYTESLAAIDRELTLSRDALDQALAAYDELQMALPLHMKYLEMMDVLEGYRDAVSDVRDEVGRYPGTFLDLTTSSCT